MTFLNFLFSIHNISLANEKVNFIFL